MSLPRVSRDAGWLAPPDDERAEKRAAKSATATVAGAEEQAAGARADQLRVLLLNVAGDDVHTATRIKNAAQPAAEGHTAAAGERRRRARVLPRRARVLARRAPQLHRRSARGRWLREAGRRRGATRGRRRFARRPPHGAVRVGLPSPPVLVRVSRAVTVEDDGGVQRWKSVAASR